MSTYLYIHSYIHYCFMSIKPNYKFSCATSSEKFASELSQIKAPTSFQFVNPSDAKTLQGQLEKQLLGKAD